MSRLKLKFRYKGGKGSGNFGHAGRPGKVGGSASGTGGGVALPSVADDDYDREELPYSQQERLRREMDVAAKRKGRRGAWDMHEKGRIQQFEEAGISRVGQGGKSGHYSFRELAGIGVGSHTKEGVKYWGVGQEIDDFLDDGTKVSAVISGIGQHSYQFTYKAQTPESRIYRTVEPERKVVTRKYYPSKR